MQLFQKVFTFLAHFKQAAIVSGTDFTGTENIETNSDKQPPFEDNKEVIYIIKVTLLSYFFKQLKNILIPGSNGGGTSEWVALGGFDRWLL